MSMLLQSTGNVDFWRGGDFIQSGRVATALGGQWLAKLGTLRNSLGRPASCDKLRYEGNALIELSIGFELGEPGDDNIGGISAR